VREGGGVLERKRILIVDDQVDVCQVLCEYLNRSGFETEAALTGEEGLSRLRGGGFDLVITDIELSGAISGLDLTQAVKREGRADVIVMTGYGADYSYEEAIGRGASDFLVKPLRYEELLLRVKRVIRERELAQERTRMLEELQKMAVTDGLTALYNSRHFYHQLELEIDRSLRYRHPLSLLLIDIDRFKEYNDTYGHLEGDKVLVRFSQILKSCLRANDSAYRYGGEEFTVILPETGAEEARTVAQRIRATLEAEIFHPHSGTPVNKTISIGVTEYCPRESLEAFVRRADQAMYRSKEAGRNRVSVIVSPAKEPAAPA